MPYFVIEGADELIDMLGELEAFAVLRDPMERGLDMLQREMATYPPARSRRQPFRSDRQRRWFFAALNEGTISVPYRRTGTLGRSWTQEIRQGPGSLVGEVGNNLEYAPYVQGHEMQSAYHAGNWQTEQEVADELMPDILREFEDVIDGFVGG